MLSDVGDPRLGPLRDVLLVKLLQTSGAVSARQWREQRGQSRIELLALLIAVLLHQLGDPGARGATALVCLDVLKISILSDR